MEDVGERWEDLLWDRVPHIIKYSRTSLDWVDRYVKLTFGLQRLHKDYSKGLFKLVKTQREKAADGRGMGKCWVGVIGHIGAVSEKHKQLATVLGDIGRKYSEEADLLAEEQRALEQTSKKLQSDLDASILDLEKTKEKYFRRQLEAEKSEDALVRGEDDEKMSGEELEKLRDHADEKKAKYNKARDDYSVQLTGTNALQTEFYQHSWPTVISGMRGVAERGVEAIISLLRRLDLLARDEWGDLGVVADEMENTLEEDFNSFLNWVKSGNPPPGEFSFEETCKPGMLPLGTMGTLRKSISRASLRWSGSTMALGGRGIGSRASLRSPTYSDRTVSPRFRSAREGQIRYFPRQSSTIRECNEQNLNGSITEDKDDHEEDEEAEDQLQNEYVREQQQTIVNGSNNGVDPTDNTDEEEEENRRADLTNGNHSTATTEIETNNPFYEEESQPTADAKTDNVNSSTASPPPRNGSLRSKYLRKEDSYDDRMNPFA